jgi:hypothetical protein
MSKLSEIIKYKKYTRGFTKSGSSGNSSRGGSTTVSSLVHGEDDCLRNKIIQK